MTWLKSNNISNLWCLPPMLAFFFTRDNSTRAMWEAYMQFSHCDENWQVAWLRSQKNPKLKCQYFILFVPISMDMGVLVIILTIRGFWVQNNATGFPRRNGIFVWRFLETLWASGRVSLAQECQVYWCKQHHAQRKDAPIDKRINKMCL